MKRNTPLKQKTPLRAKKFWNPKRSALKRTPLRKKGKVGEANIEANRIIKRTIETKQINCCEIGKLGWPEFGDCMRTWPLQNVHRHKRSFYKGDSELLSDYRQWVRGCQVCHDKIEHNADLTERVFLTLRGEESEEHQPEPAPLEEDTFTSNHQGVVF